MIKTLINFFEPGLFQGDPAKGIKQAWTSEDTKRLLKQWTAIPAAIGGLMVAGFVGSIDLSKITLDNNTMNFGLSTFRSLTFGLFLLAMHPPMRKYIGTILIISVSMYGIFKCVELIITKGACLGTAQVVVAISIVGGIALIGLYATRVLTQDRHDW